ncbi:PBP1A family penicillin-binding protein [Patescibacteria group bacterium]|nr:PBP1A family penicillin-binding protein [Patescibacteria group bacterium]
MKLPRFVRENKGITATLVIVALIAGGLAFTAVVMSDLPSPEQFANRQVAQSTKIYDRTGTVLLYEIHGDEKRTTIPFSDIPSYVKDATISIEDHNFYSEPAFDWQAILRSVFADFIAGGYVQGGSTITQQLAKNAFLSPQKTILRKVRELIVAVELERHYTKDQILGMYLNQIPYGNNAYGIEAAAETYFNKHASDLDLAESAVLSSLPQAPTYYSDGSNVSALMQRKAQVLENMKAYGYITDAQYQQALNENVQLAPQTTSIKAPHFVLTVENYLNNKYGESYVRTAGLTVVTTLDWNMQQEAEKAVADGAANNTKLYAGDNAALMAEDSTTGQILAMVGSKDYFGAPEPAGCTPGKNCLFEGNFNAATQALRQPGSAIKPFTYMAAFEKGLTPDTVLFDVPTEFDTTGIPQNSYKPTDFETDSKGPVTIRDALAWSLNIPAVKALYIAGINNMIDLASNFGISTFTERSRYGLSLTLGGAEVTMKDMVAAYSTIAQDGMHHDQSMILSVSDSKGNLLEKYQDNSKQVIDPQYPRMINDILSDTQARAGLFLPVSLAMTIFPGHEVALKTGTTNDYRDAWTMGYTPDLVVGVWVGNNDNEPMQNHGYSVLAAMPIWSEFMKATLKDRPLVSFNKPEPYASQKPMFNKDYVVNYTVGTENYPQIHNILYYINKDNILGPQPLDPTNDPQFKNWEDPVLSWAKQNVTNFSLLYNHPIPVGSNPVVNATPGMAAGGSPVITFSAPTNGSFIASSFPVSASISAAASIAHIQLLFNNTVVDDRTGSFGTSFSYQFTLVPGAVLPQNSLALRVTDAQNNTTTQQLIIYRK